MSLPSAPYLCWKAKSDVDCDAPMKHAETHCDCTAPATPLALRWRCPVCGRSAIMRVTTLATVCDGESLRKVEAQPEAN